MNVEQSLDQQVEVGGGAGLCAPGPRPLGFMLSEFDIPEEQGNVVVLYEVCWFSLATYEQFWLAEQKISSPHTFTRIL